MGDSLTRKILGAHLVEGSLVAGEEIAIRIDQTLTQDATGTMAYLQFEAMGLDRVRSELSVSYVDHNMLQTGFENADDHLYLQTVAQKYGVYFSRPGNGICHQVHLERFAKPGRTLLGSDSHTPTAGAIGCIAIGAGGLDVAVAMGGGPYYVRMPRVVRVELTGALSPWVAAKDVILHLLRLLTVKGGVDRVFEYGGPGVATLSVPQRSTITNMGAELGATTSIFPSDERTLAFLRAQGREEDWTPLAADDDALYNETIEVDLSALEPLIACPGSPDAVVPVSEVAGKRVHQVNIGSCTNSSYPELVALGSILDGRTAHPDTSVTVSPGSRQVFQMIAADGSLARIVQAGARILESACGPCIGMGQAPPTDGVSVRTFNRNFAGRCGTPNAHVYLASVEVAAAAAVTGVITDPRSLGEPPAVSEPQSIAIDDGMIVPPAEDPASVEVVRGPNIKPLPTKTPIADSLSLRVLIRLGDNISTDAIMPAGAKVLPLRSNIPAISRHVFSAVDPEFPARAEEWGGGAILGGQNYGQGSSREHAALAPMYLGVQVVLAKSFARIHRANLINFGILPLVLPEEAYDALEQGDTLELAGIHAALLERMPLAVTVAGKDLRFEAEGGLTGRQTEILLAGGLLEYTRTRGQG